MTAAPWWLVAAPRGVHSSTVTVAVHFGCRLKVQATKKRTRREPPFSLGKTATKLQKIFSFWADTDGLREKEEGSIFPQNTNQQISLISMGSECRSCFPSSLLTGRNRENLMWLFIRFVALCLSLRDLFFNDELIRLSRVIQTVVAEGGCFPRRSRSSLSYLVLLEGS